MLFQRVFGQTIAFDDVPKVSEKSLGTPRTAAAFVNLFEGPYCLAVAGTKPGEPIDEPADTFRYEEVIWMDRHYRW